MERGTYTKHEILTQTEAWSDALDVVEQNQDRLTQLLAADYQQILFTGCGSTYYLSQAAAALFQEMTGRLARAVPAGELVFNPAVTLSTGKTLLVAVSRSGSTSETVKAVEQFKAQNRGPILAITNYADQPLAGLADLALVIEKGQEMSVAQTRSFASMYVAATAVSLLAAGREDLRQLMRKLPEAGDRLIAHSAALAREIGENLELDRFYFLGSGSRYGLANEISLKMKEMTLSHSEPFHFLEFRHGPMSMANSSALVVGLLSDANRTQEQKVLSEMEALGARTFSLADTGALVNFESGLPDCVRAVLFLPTLQLMGYYRSMAKNLNPDHPENLTAVVNLNLA